MTTTVASDRKIKGRQKTILLSSILDNMVMNMDAALTLNWKPRKFNLAIIQAVLTKFISNANKLQISRSAEGLVA